MLYPCTIPLSDSVLWPRPAYWCPTMDTVPPASKAPSSTERPTGSSRAKPRPLLLFWLTPDSRASSSTLPFGHTLLGHGTPQKSIPPALPLGGPLLDCLTPLPSLHPSSPSGLPGSSRPDPRLWAMLQWVSRILFCVPSAYHREIKLPSLPESTISKS